MRAIPTSSTPPATRAAWSRSCAYPVVIEPSRRPRPPAASLERRGWRWRWRSLAACAIVDACASCRGRVSAAPLPVAEPPRVAPVSSARAGANAARWLALAAVPSSLLLSVTTYVTTDLLALPLLWVIPLALYLRRSSSPSAGGSCSPRGGWSGCSRCLLVPLAAEMFVTTAGGALVLIPVHAGGLLRDRARCHQTLAQAVRPPSGRPSSISGSRSAARWAGSSTCSWRRCCFVRWSSIRSGSSRPRCFARAAPARSTGRARAPHAIVALPVGLAALLAGGVWLLRASVRSHRPLGPRAWRSRSCWPRPGARSTPFAGGPRRFGLGLAAMMASRAPSTRRGRRTSCSRRAASTPSTRWCGTDLRC